MKGCTKPERRTKMPVYKNEDNGTWYVLTRYVDWKGERKQKCKRGFETKREAQEWERVFKQQSAADMDMNFSAFVELYIKDIKPRLKENTWLTKKHIIETKILPYFEKKNVSEITTKDVIAWQNELLAFRDEKKKPYSQTYLKTVHNQLIVSFFNIKISFFSVRRCKRMLGEFSIYGFTILQSYNDPRFFLF